MLDLTDATAGAQLALAFTTGPDVAIAQTRVAAAAAEILLPARATFTSAPRSIPETTEAQPAETGPGRIARAWTFTRTCVHAATLLPTVRQAVPWYVWPILAVAAVVKCFPLDMGTDELLFGIAFALLAWRRPGLLKALYREAQAGKPAPCQCPNHARKGI